MASYFQISWACYKITKEKSSYTIVHCIDGSVRTIYKKGKAYYFRGKRFNSLTEALSKACKCSRYR